MSSFTVANMEHAQNMYMQTSHAIHSSRHGVVKHRKSQSTGGGRAWSVAEESFLIEKREQKMPYKHIAAHLNKTDLACRLHYYQIHGKRHRRNLSCSSMPGTFRIDYGSSMPPSPPSSASPSAPGSPKDGVLVLGGNVHEVHLPPILPRASSVSEGRFPTVDEARRVPLPPLTASRQQSPFSQQQQHHHHQQQHQQKESLRLDTSLPSINGSWHDPSHVDMARLQSIYGRHGQSFWSSIAAEYGTGASPTALEQAWKTGFCCQQPGGARPVTPEESPMSISSLMCLSADRSNHWDQPMKRVPEERTLA